jgi:hypothetical protein
LEIFAGGIMIARVVANRYRNDLDAAGLGSGRHGFRLPFSGPARHIEARRLSNGTVLGIVRHRSGGPIGPAMGFKF